MADTTSATLQPGTPETPSAYVKVIDAAVDEFLIQNVGTHPVSVVHAASLPSATTTGKTLGRGVAMRREGDGHVYAKTFGSRSARVSIDSKG